MDQGSLYILRTNEVVWTPKKDMNILAKMKPVILAIVLVLIAGSIIFKDNLLSEMNWTARVLLGVLFVRTIIEKRTEETPSPIELQFFSDRLVVFREKRYISKKVQRKEWYTILYNDVSRCILRSNSEKLCIYCNYDAVCFTYRPDGSLSEKPSYQKHVDEGLCFFYTTFAKDVNFVQEFEEHSPLRVVIEET